MNNINSVQEESKLHIRSEIPGRDAGGLCHPERWQAVGQNTGNREQHPVL